VELRIRESFDPGWRVLDAGGSTVRLIPEPGTGMMLCQVGAGFGGEEIRLTYRPVWFDRSVGPAVLAAAVCVAGLVVPSGQFRKWSETYFSVRRTRG